MAQRPKSSQVSHLTGIQIDRGNDIPLYWQFYLELKRLLLTGAIQTGDALPSARSLAREFSCSRHTVATAFEYLQAEGLLSSSQGVGTFVVDTGTKPVAAAATSVARQPITISRFAQRLAEKQTGRDEQDPLQTFGIPDAGSFPFGQWTKAYANVWRDPSPALRTRIDHQGFVELRQSICKLLHRTRGITASPENVLITSGTTQSLYLLVQLLLEPGAQVVIEDPGRPKVEALLRASEIAVHAWPVDQEGLQLQKLEPPNNAIKAVIVTPSHHYPTGASLSLQRRLTLLDWAHRNNNWIFEDDYDGEILADGKPVAPLYSLGQSDRVVYMGTFSKSIHPQLRLGYIVARPDLIRELIKVRYYIDYFPSTHLQPVLANFIDDGSLERHLRKMRRLYRDRQNAFIGELRRQDPGFFLLSEFAPTLFLPLHFAAGADFVDDTVVAGQVRAASIPCFGLSSFYTSTPPDEGLIVGTSRLEAGDASTNVALILRAMAKAQSDCRRQVFT
ncbi:PLP-dependent aminotransferase family protein [Phyllobacterium endophyticum]|nr:PLP-dependent aminotransferase family protein [Phyllobacterium endophyticum]MBB3237079.1 GntR family transcriptional regulator/MocR family aminotransferase [Phyllobacterium endophyticum]